MIVGTKVWELRVMGEVPPGLTDEQVQATIMANFAIVGSILATVRDVKVNVRSAGADSSGPKLHV